MYELRAIDTTTRAFWAAFLAGLLAGAVEGSRVMVSARHIFSIFPKTELLAAVAKAMVLEALLLGLGAAAVAALIWAAGSVIRPLRSATVVVWAVSALAFAALAFVTSAWWGGASLLGGALNMRPADALGMAVLIRCGLALLVGVGLALPVVFLFRLFARVSRARASWWPQLPSSPTLAVAAVVTVLVGLPVVGLDRASEDLKETGGEGSDRPNLLLIVVDALRGDRLGCYGYVLPTSPNLDALCDRAIVFEQAVVQYPATGPSFGSLFTGKYPRKHGLSSMDPRAWIGGEFNRTLAEILREQGYATAAVMTGSLTRSSGLARGFTEVFEEHPSYAMHRTDSAWQALRSRLGLSRTAMRARRAFDRQIVVSEAERWLSRDRDRPFLLFVHLFDTHSPYDPPAKHLALFDRDYRGPHRAIYGPLLRSVRFGGSELSPADVDRLEALYDAEVRTSDESIGRLLQVLDRQGLADNTVVVVTADHGEELYDHRLVEHGYVYNTNLRVPLILYLPGRTHAVRIDGPVELIDLMPTLLELLEAPIPAGIDGELLPLDPDRRGGGDESAETAAAFAEADCQSVGGGTTRDCWLSVQTARWKLDRNHTQDVLQLFDLTADPLELVDVASAHPEVVATLEERLLLWNSAQPDLPMLREELSRSGRQEIEDRLRALGYIE